MKASIQLITPEIAQDYLKANVENRKLKQSHVDLLAESMKSGNWKETGANSIIFDSNGVLKNGQHTLYAIIKAKHEFNSVVVREVDPDVMDVIDTGLNRNLNDVLFLNGFTTTALLAATIRSIIIYNRRKNVGVPTTKRVLNDVGLRYAKKHKETLMNYVVLAQKINQKTTRVSSTSFVAVALHIVTQGRAPTDQHEDFIKRITGLVIVESAATAWFFKTFQRAKKDKVRYDDYWRVGILIKIWNLFIEGDHPIRYIKFDVEEPFPKVL